MKKIFSFALIAVSVLLGACTTSVVVDSTMATYDNLSGGFEATLSGNINNAFKATNIALERDLKYFRVGQKAKDNQWYVYARVELDVLIVVYLKQLPNDEVQVKIEYGSGNLMKSQQIFNAIAKNMRMFERR